VVQVKGGNILEAVVVPGTDPAGAGAATSKRKPSPREILDSENEESMLKYLADPTRK
jgi:hypothetical protein